MQSRGVQLQDVFEDRKVPGGVQRFMMSLGRVQDLGICSFVKSLGLGEGAMPRDLQLQESLIGSSNWGYAAPRILDREQFWESSAS